MNDAQDSHVRPHVPQAVSIYVGDGNGVKQSGASERARWSRGRSARSSPEHLGRGVRAPAHGFRPGALPVTAPRFQLAQTDRPSPPLPSTLLSSSPNPDAPLPLTQLHFPRFPKKRHPNCLHAPHNAPLHPSLKTHRPPRPHPLTRQLPRTPTAPPPARLAALAPPPDHARVGRGGQVVPPAARAAAQLHYRVDVGGGPVLPAGGGGRGADRAQEVRGRGRHNCLIGSWF